MDNLKQISSLLWIYLSCLLLVTILSPVVVLAACDQESVASSAQDPDALFPAMTLAAADGTMVEIQVTNTDASNPVKIQLAPAADTVDTGNYYEIVIGTDYDAGDAYPGGRGTNAAIFKVTGGTPDTSNPVSLGVAGLSASNFKAFFIRIVTNNDNSITVGIGDQGDTGDFVSLTDSSAIISGISFISFTGEGTFLVCDPNKLVDSYTIHDAASSDVTSALTDDATCTSTSTNGGATNLAGFVVYLGGEYEVLGVRIRHSETGTMLTGGIVRVGNCGYIDVLTESLDVEGVAADIDDNVDCGVVFTAGEAGASPVYRTCPTNTYGNVMYIYRDDGTALANICDLTIFAIKRPDDEKTTVSFQTAAYGVTENDGDSGTNVPQPITLVRTGVSAENPTCTIVRVFSTSNDLDLDQQTGDGSCTNGEDVVHDNYAAGDLLASTTPAIVVFGADASVTTTTLDLTVCGDYAAEDTEFVTLGFDEQDYTACTGTTPTTTLTITDEDPDYYFDDADLKYEWTENANGDLTISLTVKKTGNLQETTKISVETDTTAYFMMNAAIDTMDYSAETRGDREFTFQPSDDSVEITFTLIDDDVDEILKMFDVNIYFEAGDGSWQQAESVTVTGGETIQICLIDNEPLFTFDSPPTPTFDGIETDGSIEVLVQNQDFANTDIEHTITLTPSNDGTDDTATATTDFPITPIQITFAVGQEFESVSVPIVNDAIEENAEMFTVTLTATDVSYIHSMGGVAELTINDDDAPVSMAVSAKDVTERQSEVEVFISRAGSYLARTAWVDLSVTPGSASDEDFIEPSVLRVYFEDGSDTTSISIPIVNDNEVEDNETFTVTIVDADNPIHETDFITTVNIISDDALIWLAQDPDEVVEGEIYTATIMREGGDGFDHSVYFNTNSDIADGATAGVDFEVISMVYTFTDNVYSKEVPVQTIEDELIEDVESFRVSISEPNEQVDPDRNSVIVHILDDDSLIGFDQVLYDVTETTGSDTVVEVTLTRGGDTSSSATVYLSTVEVNGAQAGTDFEAISDYPVTFLQDENTVSQEITIEADSTPEFAEIFQVIVRSDTSGGLDNIDPNRSAANITVLDDDSGSFRFEDDEYIVDEGEGFVNVNILRPGSTSGYVTLLVTASPGSASYPADYLQEEVTVEFAPGQDVATASFTIVSDTDIQEGDETLELSLSVVSSFGTVDEDYDGATVTIVDSRSTFALSTSSPIVVESEPGYVEITVRRSGSTNTEATVSLRTVDGSATHSGDFEGFNQQTFYFPSGRSELTFRIPIDNNNFEEDPEETFSVYVLGENNQPIEESRLIVTILDDDGYFSFVPTSNEVDEEGIVTYRTTENSGIVTLKVQRTGNNQGFSSTYSVRAYTTDGTAAGRHADKDDYGPLSGRVINFSPSLTTSEFTVTIINDDEYEKDEEFFVELDTPYNGAVVLPYKARIIIESNDRALGRPDELSQNAIIGIAVGVGGVFIIAIIAGVAFCLLAPRRTPPVQPKSPALFPGARPPPALQGASQFGVPPDPRFNAGYNPYQPQGPGYYPY